MKVLGNQLQYAASVLAARKRPTDAGSGVDLKKRIELAAQAARVITQIVISLILLIVCFGLIKSSSDEAVKKGCFALVGTVVGYWLH